MSHGSSCFGFGCGTNPWGPWTPVVNKALCCVGWWEFQIGVGCVHMAWIGYPVCLNISLTGGHFVVSFVTFVLIRGFHVHPTMTGYSRRIMHHIKSEMARISLRSILEIPVGSVGTTFVWPESNWEFIWRGQYTCRGLLTICGSDVTLNCRTLPN